MKYNWVFGFLIISFYFSCKKDKGLSINNYPETYPSTYVSLEWHIKTPYVRMFTRNGEIRDENPIREYLQRKGLTEKFYYQEIVPESYFLTKKIYLYSPDSIAFRLWNDQIPDLIANYKLNSLSGNELYFKSPVIKKSEIERGFMSILQLRNSLSSYRWPYEIYPDLTSDTTFGEYKYKPEFYAYKADTNLLAIPNIRFHKTGYSMSAYNFANKFNISGLLSLSTTDTLLIQESELFYKKQ